MSNSSINLLMPIELGSIGQVFLLGTSQFLMSSILRTVSVSESYMEILVYQVSKITRMSVLQEAFLEIPKTQIWSIITITVGRLVDHMRDMTIG